MTKESAKGNLIHAIRWNDMPKKEALEMAIKALEQCEVWNGIHGQVVAPKGTFDRIWEDAEKEEQEPKTGHWIYDKSIDNWKCSECGETPKTLGYVGSANFMREHFKYCNHCGARMSEVIE